MDRTELSSQLEKVNTVQNIFWKSETAIERLLLVLAGIMLWKPGFWLILLICYALFEAGLLIGRYFQKIGIIIGGQVVVTGALLLLFHEIPDFFMVQERVEEPSYLQSVGIIAAVALVIYVVLYFASKVPAIIGMLVVAADIYIIVQEIFRVRGLNYFSVDRTAIAAAIALTTLELWRVISLFQEKFFKDSKNVRYIGGEPVSLVYRWLVFFVLMELIVIMIPVNEKPIDWSIVYQIGYRVRDGFETFAENTGYFFSGIGSGGKYQSGYSGLSLVPGEITGNSRDELYITTDGTKNSLYLAGHIEGDRESIADEMKGDRILDFLYALYSHDIGREEAKCFARVMKLNVEFGYLRTKDVIKPENTLLVQAVKKEDEENDGLQFEKLHKKGDSYDVVYLNVDYGSRYLENVMRSPVKADIPSYSEMEDYCGKLLDYQLSRSVTEREYGEWTAKKTKDQSDKKDTYEEYLKPGDLATSRMKELADSITNGALGDYDACRRIEKYLRQYRYTITPGKAADGANYLERFLFETGEGYCVHYASSMVELLRLSGIPARYVEGYCYTFPKAKHDRFTVSGDRAHVWVEAYIDGMGWVPFEPTAARRTSIDSSWNYTVPEEELSPDEMGAQMNAGDIYIPDIPENTAGFLPDEGNGSDDDIPEKHVIDLEVVGKLLGTIVLGLLIYGLLMWGAIVLIRLFRYQRAPMAGKLEKNMKDILWYMDREFADPEKKARILEDYVAVLPEGEGVSGERLMITDLRDLSEHIFSVYYRQRFAGRSATGAEVRDSEYLRKYLRKRYIRQMFSRRKDANKQGFRDMLT